MMSLHSHRVMTKRISPNSVLRNNNLFITYQQKGRVGETFAQFNTSQKDKIQLIESKNGNGRVFIWSVISLSRLFQDSFAKLELGPTKRPVTPRAWGLNTKGKSDWRSLMRTERQVHMGPQSAAAHSPRISAYVSLCCQSNSLLMSIALCTNLWSPWMWHLKVSGKAWDGRQQLLSLSHWWKCYFK